MISLMLVAGFGSKQLATFLQQRGTFSVDFVHNDLHSNADVLMRNIVKVDKFVYIYRINEETGSSDMNVRTDMQTLRNLIQTGGFFKPREFLFLSEDGKLYTAAKKYFTTVMEECGIKNYELRTIDKAASFSSIYDKLIGTTLTRDFKNTYKPLYRMERGSTADTSYTPSANADLVVEPTNFDNLRNWEEQKRLAQVVERNTQLSDPDNVQRAELNSPNFTSIRYSDLIASRRYVMVTGVKRSGKSLWAANLAFSATNAGKHVCVVDFTTSQDLEDLLLDFNTVDLSSLLGYRMCDSNIVCPVNDQELLSDIVAVLHDNVFQLFDTVIIVMDDNDYLRAKEVLKIIMTDLFVTGFNRPSDVKHIMNVILGKKVPCTLALCSGGDDNGMSPEDIKAQIKCDNVIKPFELSSCKDIPWLYKKVILGGGSVG